MILTGIFIQKNRKSLFYIFSANGSQFFFTFSETSELNGRATLFGRVVGDTIFNLLRMGELEVDPKTDSPLYPPLIIDTDVILNPFKDIIPRVLVSKSLDTKTCAKSDVNSLQKKNISLLSFAISEKDIDHSHFYAQNNNDPSVKNQKMVQSESPPIHRSQTSSSLQFLQQMKAVQMRDVQSKIKSMEIELGLLAGEKSVNEKVLKYSLSSHESKTSISALEKYKLKFAESKKRKPSIDSKDELETIIFLNSFRKKIQNTGTKLEDIDHEPLKKHLDICKLHGLLNCLSCKNNFNINLDTENLGFDEEDWLMHKLVFDRRELEGQIREDLKELVVIDPKNQFDKSNKNIAKFNKNE
jgi:peptidyl-prolyl cis-trans isomerase SDCCAG10